MEVFPKGQRSLTHVEHDPPSETASGNAGKYPQTAKVVEHCGRPCFDLDPNNLSRWGLKNEVDLLPLGGAEVVEGRTHITPPALLEDLRHNERLDEGAPELRMVQKPPMVQPDEVSCQSGVGEQYFRRLE